ncbi:hypothetical protein RZS08_62810, partial [Arthrospira platensis SPKY1]|nr:hypothetical protein [Arthrospira platensis SPKY1]
RLLGGGHQPPTVGGQQGASDLDDPLFDLLNSDCRSFMLLGVKLRLVEVEGGGQVRFHRLQHFRQVLPLLVRQSVQHLRAGVQNDAFDLVD